MEEPASLQLMPIEGSSSLGYLTLRPEEDFQLPVAKIVVLGRNPGSNDPTYVRRYPGREVHVKIISKDGRTDPAMPRRAVILETFPNLLGIAIINPSETKPLQWRLGEAQRSLAPGDAFLVKPGTDIRNLKIEVAPNLWLQPGLISGPSIQSVRTFPKR